MIVFFTSLCKHILDNISDDAIFRGAIKTFKYHNERCPSCRAVGKLFLYGDYSRDLVSHDGKNVIESVIKPPRFKCKSCGVTHALLPDIIIPHSPYSLRFILTVLVAYFERNTTVQAVCDFYGIAVSTLYAWRDRLLEHKDLLLGMLTSQKEPAQTFLQGLLNSIRISEQLSNFFSLYAFSFMQNRPAVTTHSKPP
jgi:transposase-like protein